LNVITINWFSVLQGKKLVSYLITSIGNIKLVRPLHSERPQVPDVPVMQRVLNQVRKDMRCVRLSRRSRFLLKMEASWSSKTLLSCHVTTPMSQPRTRFKSTVFRLYRMLYNLNLALSSTIQGLGAVCLKQYYKRETVSLWCENMKEK